MIIDAHCDMLYRIWAEGLDVNSDEALHVDLEKWRKSPVQVQTFAMYVPDTDTVPDNKQYPAVLEMLQIFKEQVIGANEDIVHIKTKSDLENLREGELGAILTLEGCYPIGDDLDKLKYLVDEGVRLVGLTWNNNNAVADSITEENPQGVTEFGREVIDYLNSENIWVDVSHISVPGFYDVMELAKHPIASHSNARVVHPAARNLMDEQIEALIERDGLIGIVLYPEFINGKKEAAINEVMEHLDYFIKKGAEDNLCIGSDFDGISTTITGLENISKYDNLSERIRSEYLDQAEAILGGNFLEKFPRQ